MSWKKEFVPGETVVLKGAVFKVVNIGKRGLALRHVGNFAGRGSKERDAAIKRWLAGELP